MIAGVGGGGHRQAPGRAIGDLAIDLAGHNDLLCAKNIAQLLAGGHVLGAVDVPHNLGKLVILAKNQTQIARPGRAAFGRKRRAGRGAFEDNSLIGIGHGGGGGKHGPAAHAMAFQTNIGLIDHGQAAQIGQARWPTKALGKGRPAAIAMAGLVHGQDDIAAPCKLNRKPTLSFAAIDIAVHGQDTGGWLIRCRGLGGIE